MAQSNFEERIDTYEIESTNVMTGDRDRSRYLYYQLKMSMAKAKRIDIIVSFLMESGVRMLLNDMKRALERGVKIRILTGNYLGITQPSALYLIKSELGDRVDLRLYNETSRSFHPKSYIFHYESSNEIYIGSSNISKSALTSGIEWNYRFSDILDKKNYELFYATFEDLFLNHSIIIDDEELKRYSKAWKKPAVSRDLAKYDTAEDNEDRNTENVRMLYRPRGAQIEALYALQESRMEGAAKGLVYAATGIGKTYLAAFDSAKYERVLFVAHREEILKQAAVSFKNVRNSEDYGFFDGKEKDRDKSVIFASVATLGRTEYLNETYFPADYFDYVIIDEFHHAVTDQYRRIVEYFQPQFLLGLTATPERMDGKNIYEICDYNVPYQISLKEAINKGMLVPFHYYGVYDETDYSRLRIVKGRYDEQELNQAYSINNNNRISIPDNLYIVGTMNTADKSIGGIDYAIRRRFLFFEQLPDIKVIEEYKAEKGSQQLELNAQACKLFENIETLFEENYLSSEYRKEDVQIGHTYFLVDSKDKLMKRFEYQIIPILKEYYKDGIINFEISDETDGFNGFLNCIAGKINMTSQREDIENIFNDLIE